MREIKPTCCSGFYLHHICCSTIGQCKSHGQGLVSAEGLKGNKDKPDRTLTICPREGVQNLHISESNLPG